MIQSASKQMEKKVDYSKSIHSTENRIRFPKLID